MERWLTDSACSSLARGGGGAVELSTGSHGHHRCPGDSTTLLLSVLLLLLPWLMLLLPCFFDCHVSYFYYLATSTTLFHSLKGKKRSGAPTCSHGHHHCPATSTSLVILLHCYFYNPAISTKSIRWSRVPKLSLTHTMHLKIGCKV